MLTGLDSLMDDGKPGQTYRCGDLVVDTRRHRVLRGGVELALEPKAYGVLLELLRRRGGVVARDALLDAVWGHRHVTPAVLNRVVALLRRELGDEADHPHLIRTVHGVGYEFIGVVATAPADAGPRPAVAASAVEAVVPRAAPGPRAGPRTFVLVLLALAAVLTTYVWSRSGPSWPAATRSAATTIPPSRPAWAPALVVLPLRALGGDHGETLLAEGLSEELTTRLSRIEGLGVICATSATIAQSRQLDSVQLSEQLKATLALEGSLHETGDQLRVNLRLSELPDGRVIWTQVYDRPVAGFATLQDDVAAEIARTLSLRDAGGTGAVRIVDPVALRRFLDLRRRIRGGGVPDWEAQLRSLVAAYPDYAQPHGLLGSLLALHAPSRREEAEREAGRAMQLDPDEADARITLAWTAIQDGDWERASPMYEEALRLAPTDPFYHVLYGVQLGSLGYLEQGLDQVEIGMAYGPLGGAAAITTQAYLLDALGRHDEARRSIDAARVASEALNPGPILAYASWFNAFWRHDAAAARAAAADMPEGIWKASYEAVVAALEDPRQWPRARAAMDASERAGREQGNPDATSDLRLLDPRIEPAAMLALTRRLQRQVFTFPKLTIWMPERHAVRQTREFQDFLRDTGILGYWRAHGFPPQCRADGDGARCG